jgi:hypothetical protein
MVSESRVAGEQRINSGQQQPLKQPMQQPVQQQQPVMRETFQQQTVQQTTFQQPMMQQQTPMMGAEQSSTIGVGTFGVSDVAGIQDIKGKVKDKVVGHSDKTATHHAAGLGPSKTTSKATDSTSKTRH